MNSTTSITSACNSHFSANSNKVRGFAERLILAIKSIVERGFAAMSSPVEKTDSLDLTPTDKFLTTTNLIHWGLTGASLYGVTPTIIMPLHILSGLGADIATFCALPKDASWLRKAMAIPGLSRAILSYNPWVSRFLQVTSLYSLAKNTTPKLTACWGHLKSDPVRALKAGAVHLFNLASSIAFAAESAGLIQLSTRSAKNPEENRCDYTKEGDCQKNRKIKIATVYHNSGDDQEHRQAISNLSTENHEKYAKHWNLEHDVVTENLAHNQCEHPFSKENQDCSQYWNKIKYFKNWCEKPAIEGSEEWTIYTDDDSIYTNFNIDPSVAIDQLRGRKDSSFIIGTEGEGNRTNPGAVNTGMMIVRNDKKGCSVIDKIWESRNKITDPNNPNCLTYGICNDQSNGNEQGAIDHVLWNVEPSLLNKYVTRVLARDSTHPKRGNIALNTLNRSGCMTTQQKDGTLTDPFDIHIYDMSINPEGVYREGDWSAQTKGYPIYGQDLSHQPMGQCKDDPSIPVEPIRIKKIIKMIQDAERSLKVDPRSPMEMVPYHQKLEETFDKIVIPDRPVIPQPQTKKITFGVVYDNSSDPNRDAISDFVNQNHAAYAKKWDLNHEIVAKNLVANQCHTGEGKPTDCAAYWNKIQMIREWLAEPQKPGVEEWRCYLDDDMLVMNSQIDPDKAIDALRGGSDTSFIIAEDVIDWQRWFFEEEVPHVSVNTGAFFVRKDDRARALVEGIWKLRDTPVVSPTADCENIGTCRLQDRTMQEQEALTILLRRQPELIDDVITVIPPRDTDSKTRSHIAMNTFYRDGCFMKKNKAANNQVFSFEAMDSSENPSGRFQKGDWLVQAAGVPIWGKDLPFSYGKTCVDLSHIPEEPLRYKRLQELAKFSE